jgi:hypothetical protein
MADVVEPSEVQTRSARRAAREALRPERTLPVAPPSGPVLLATLGFAAVMGVCVAAGPLFAAAAVAFLGIVLAWGWVTLLDLPSPRGVGGVVAGTAVGGAAFAVVVLDDPLLRWVPVALALGVVAAFAHQILRTDGRHRLTVGLAGTVSGIVVVAMGLPYAGVAVPARGQWVAAVVLGGVAVAVLAEMLARWSAVQPLAVLLGALVSAGGGYVLAGPFGLSGGLAAGAGALGALVSQSVRRVFHLMAGAQDLRGGLAVASATVLSTGVVAYVLTRVLVA